METVEEELCFPHLHNSSCRKPQADPAETLLHYALLSLIALPTAILNLLVIISISHFRQLHSSTNLILLSLAVSDFLTGLVVIPTARVIWTTCWILGDLMCALYYVLPSTILIASVGNIVLISVDRYVAICDPLHYTTRMSERVVSISLCLCWLYAFVYAFLFLLENFTNPGKYNSCHGECVIYFSREVGFIMAFVIPITIVIVVYMRVFVAALSQARAMRSNVTAIIHDRARSRTSKKSEIKAARNLGIVVLVYLMCYCPYYCLAYSETNVRILGIPIEVVLFSLIYVNSCLNPLIYASLYPWFRKAIKLIVTLQILKPGSCDYSLDKDQASLS